MSIFALSRFSLVWLDSDVFWGCCGAAPLEPLARGGFVAVFVIRSYLLALVHTCLVSAAPLLNFDSCSVPSLRKDVLVVVFAQGSALLCAAC